MFDDKEVRLVQAQSSFTTGAVDGEHARKNEGQHACAAVVPSVAFGDRGEGLLREYEPRGSRPCQVKPITKASGRESRGPRGRAGF